MIPRISLDQAFALILLPVVFPLLVLLYVVVVAAQGRPFLYASERMRDVSTPFSLLKIRTMHSSPDGQAQSALGGHARNRITPLGGILRKTRLDELPQIFNVLRGDIRFIGPRPPLRRYVEEFPDLYARLLEQTPPGITGLATVMLHGREERLLARCRTAAETDDVYRRRCIPIKARLDLLYCRRRCLWLNLMILWRTFSRLTLRASADRRAPAVDSGTVVWLAPPISAGPDLRLSLWSGVASEVPSGPAGSAPPPMSQSVQKRGEPERGRAA